MNTLLSLSGTVLDMMPNWDTSSLGIGPTLEHTRAANNTRATCMVTAKTAVSRSGASAINEARCSAGGSRENEAFGERAQYDKPRHVYNAIDDLEQYVAQSVFT